MKTKYCNLFMIMMVSFLSYLNKSWLLILLLASGLFQCTDQQEQLKLGVFNFNVTPPIGSPVAYSMTRSIQDSLYAKGIVILSNQAPIVLCAVDWIGIANEGLDRWKNTMAKAAGTTPDRVSIHPIHQHDGVHWDFTTSGTLDY